MNHEEIKIMIIENFIDYFASEDSEREMMKKCLEDYMVEERAMGYDELDGVDIEKTDACVLCGKPFVIGIDGNELGFCVDCQDKPDFPYDIDAYYRDYDADKVVFKGFETMSRGLLEKYRKTKSDA
jgi:hypothetical protein